MKTKTEYLDINKKYCNIDARDGHITLSDDPNDMYGKVLIDYSMFIRDGELFIEGTCIHWSHSRWVEPHEVMPKYVETIEFKSRLFKFFNIESYKSVKSGWVILKKTEPFKYRTNTYKISYKDD